MLFLLHEIHLEAHWHFSGGGETQQKYPPDCIGPERSCAQGQWNLGGKNSKHTPQIALRLSAAVLRTNAIWGHETKKEIGIFQDPLA